MALQAFINMAVAVSLDAGQGHDPAVHLLWRLVAVAVAVTMGFALGGHAAALAYRRTEQHGVSPSCGRRGHDHHRALHRRNRRSSFPAQALAQELTKRGKTIVVMTDARGKQYKAYFPGARIEIVPAAAFSDRSKLRLLTAPFEILAGIVLAFFKLLRIRPAAVVASAAIRACL